MLTTKKIPKEKIYRETYQSYIYQKAYENNALLETEAEIEDNLLSAKKNFREIHKFAKDLHAAHFISIDQENARENKTTEDIDKILGNACETKRYEKSYNN